ncbi:hypothetical protein H8959_004050 [Pygathrix nigripes]
MSFTTRSTFSTNSQSLGSVQPPSCGTRPVSSTANIYAGSRGLGFQISMSCSTSFWCGLGSGGLATGMAGGLAGMGAMQNKKETMQSLNDHLAYLDRVRSLETENWRLESKIQEYLEKGPHVRDWGHYFKTIKDLRAQIFANTVDNVHIILQIDNAHLAADDFRVKYETELAMHQSVESNVHGLHKVTDDTNVTPLQLETEMGALEELLLMKKNHEEEVKDLQVQIANSGLAVERNPDKLDKYWSQQIEERTTVVTTQSAKVGGAEMTFMDLRHTVQCLEINLDSMRDLKTSLENSLREVEARYALQMEQLNGILLHLESKLAQTWAEGQREVQEYEDLLNIKVKLEAEIATDRRLLEDSEGLNLGDALDSSHSMQTIQKTNPPDSG